MPFVNFSAAQFCNAGCSSFKKIPRYLTVGEPCAHPLDVTNSSECFETGTSAHLSKAVSKNDLHSLENNKNVPIPRRNTYYKVRSVVDQDGG